jgi:hypothetical protein
MSELRDNVPTRGGSHTKLHTVPADAAIGNGILRVNHDESVTLRVDILWKSAPSTRSPASTTGMGLAEKSEESRNTSRIATFVRE